MKKTIILKSKEGNFPVTGDVIKFVTLPDEEFILHKALDIYGNPVKRHWRVTHSVSSLLFSEADTKSEAEFLAEVKSINRTPEQLANAIREHLALA